MAGAIYQMQQISITSASSFVSLFGQCGINTVSPYEVTATVRLVASGDVQVGTPYAFTGNTWPPSTGWTQVPYPVPAGTPFELTYRTNTNLANGTDLCVYNPSATAVSVNFILLMH